MDVDLTADASAFGTNALAELAERIGVPMVPEPARFAARNRVLPVRTPESVEVDLNLATSPFEHDAIARAETVDVEGTPIRVVAPEDLVVLRIVSERARDQDDGELDDLALAERYANAKRAAGLS